IDLSHDRRRDKLNAGRNSCERREVKMSDRRTVHRVCPFCEATCGLAVECEADSIVTVRGDKEDPFSRGYICPKAYGLKELYHDPDRLRRPGRGTPAGWGERRPGTAHA